MDRLLPECSWCQMQPLRVSGPHGKAWLAVAKHKSSPGTVVFSRSGKGREASDEGTGHTQLLSPAGPLVTHKASRLGISYSVFTAEFAPVTAFGLGAFLSFEPLGCT